LKQKVFYGSGSNFIAAWKLFRFARHKNKTVFHVWGIGPFFLFVLRLSGIRKLVYSIHGTVYWNNGRQKVLRKIFWWLAIRRKEYRFTSNSEFSRKVFLDKIDSKADVEVLYNPISLKKFNSLGREISEIDIIKKIIYAGRLDSGKGLLKWIKYAASIHKINQGIKFEIYGDGHLKPFLQETILKYDAEAYIILKGYINDIREAYRSADLLLFVSEFESFGNVVVESILCGT
jgi:glycosyltransferase involved in cell wall biosynthesis